MNLLTGPSLWALLLHGCCCCSRRWRPRTRTSSSSVVMPGGEVAKDAGSGDFSVLVQYHAPCIMPWLWDEAAPSADPRMRPSHISLRAGSRGA